MIEVNSQTRLQDFEDFVMDNIAILPYYLSCGHTTREKLKDWWTEGWIGNTWLHYWYVAQIIEQDYGILFENWKRQSSQTSSSCCDIVAKETLSS